MWIEHPGPCGAAQLKALWRRAFGDPDDFIDAFFSAAYSPDRCRCALEEGRLAGMLFWLDGACRGQKTAYLYAVATDPDFRGRGICRALMADARELLKARGYGLALLYPAGEGLRKMYGKMGYRDWGRGREFSCAASGGEGLRRIGPAEYGSLRRQYLPEGAVIQENENLRLLAAAADLYAGEGFLLAASVKDGVLTAPELLGRGDAAPGILGTLGCETGSFRMGAEAMGLGLAAGAPETGYLGLAFD